MSACLDKCLRTLLKPSTVESPTMIRYGEPANDELFVTIGAAKDGVKVKNESSRKNLVILKHFGPGNPDAPVR